MIYILDAGPMIAYLQSEVGGDVVRNILADPTATCYAHNLNMIEVYYHFVRAFNETAAEQAIAALAADGVQWRRDLSSAFSKDVARLKARGGLSLADCFCIALAQLLSGEVVTTDHHEFDRLVPLGLCPILFIR